MNKNSTNNTVSVKGSQKGNKKVSVAYPMFQDTFSGCITAMKHLNSECEKAGLDNRVSLKAAFKRNGYRKPSKNNPSGTLANMGYTLEPINGNDSALVLTVDGKRFKVCKQADSDKIRIAEYRRDSQLYCEDSSKEYYDTTFKAAEKYIARIGINAETKWETIYTNYMDCMKARYEKVSAILKARKALLADIDSYSKLIDSASKGEKVDVVQLNKLATSIIKAGGTLPEIVTMPEKEVTLIKNNAS